MKRFVLVLSVFVWVSTSLAAWKIPNGSDDQVVMFAGMQSIDPTQAFTGGTTFTVKYSINGGTLTTMTTPAVAEIGDGLYSVLCDESGMTTIPDANDTANLAVEIIHTGMVTTWVQAVVYEPMSTIADIQSAVADAVWDEDLSTYLTPGTGGYVIYNSATIADFNDAMTSPDTVTAIQAGLATTTLVGDVNDVLRSDIAGIEAGSGLTAQETRDAMKLAPSAGAAAAGSIDKLLTDTPASVLSTFLAGRISSLSNMTFEEWLVFIYFKPTGRY